jgi:hypothetical protein
MNCCYVLAADGLNPLPLAILSLTERRPLFRFYYRDPDVELLWVLLLGDLF